MRIRYLDMRMKICLINSLYPPFSRGGAEAVAEMMAQGLAQAGQEVFVITLGRVAAVEDIEGVKIYRIKPGNLFSFIDIGQQPKLSRFFWHLIDVFNFSGAAQIKKILSQEKPDLVISHNLKGIGYLVPKAIKNLKIRHFCVLHDVQLVKPSGLIYKGEEKIRWLEKVYARICRWLFDSPEVIISPSQWLLDFYSKYGFFRDSEKAVVRNPIGIRNQGSGIRDGKGLNLLYLGQIEKHKGILWLAEILKNSTLDFKLTIAGEGAELEEVKKITFGDGRFEVVGKVEKDKLAVVFAKTNFLFLPSLCDENSPVVIPLSFSFGVPVIIADIGGAGELVAENKTGFKFQAGDEKSFFEALEKAKQSDWQKLSEAVKEVAGDLRVEKYVERILGLV